MGKHLFISVNSVPSITMICMDVIDHVVIVVKEKTTAPQFQEPSRFQMRNHEEFITDIRFRLLSFSAMSQFERYPEIR